MTPPAGNAKTNPTPGFLWFAIIAFALMLAVWLTLFILAATHPVQEIPLKPTAAPTPLSSPASATRAATASASAPAPRQRD
jgi:hypothetical protein